MALSEARHHTMFKPALLKKVIEAEKYLAPRGPKMEWAETHDAPRGQKKGDVEVAETISQMRITKPMVEHTFDVSVPQVFDEVVDSVDVPMPQFVEEVAVVAQISPKRVMEHIVFDVPQ